VSLSYQHIANTGHRLTDGSLIPRGQSADVSIFLDAEYAFTDRFSVEGALPYVFAKFTSPNPPRPPIPYLPVDQCHCWKGALQDFDFTARYNVVGSRESAFALTPSLSFGVPSHDYNFRGEAVPGRDLKELRIALDAGQRLDAISERLSIEGRYSYAFVERVLDIPNNRSNAIIQGNYLLTRRLLARGLVAWQRTHGGLRFGSGPGSSLVFPGEVNTTERLYQHDRLLRDNNWKSGGAISYSFRAFDVFASYIQYAGGTDTHAGNIFTTGVSWPFELGRHRP